MSSTITVKLTCKNGAIYPVENLVIPDYLEPIIQSQTRKYKFHSNNVKGKICLVCGVNFTRMNKEILSWAKRNICEKCNLVNPCILMGVTSTLTFTTCQMQWWLNEIENIKSPYSFVQLEGILGHELDRFLIKTINQEDVFEELKVLCTPGQNPSLDQVFANLYCRCENFTVKLIEDMCKRENDLTLRKCLGELFVKHKLDLMSVVYDFCLVYTLRVAKDIKYLGGSYRTLPQTIWKERTVFGYDEYNGVRVLGKGRIDKLYEISDKIFVIRDDKFTKVIGDWVSSKFGFHKPNLQEGAYKHYLEQLYSNEVHMLGIIHLGRYTDYVPVIADEMGFLTVLESVCKFIRDKKTPKMSLSQTGICKPQWCNHFNNYCYKEEPKALNT